MRKIIFDFAGIKQEESKHNVIVLVPSTIERERTI